MDSTPTRSTRSRNVEVMFSEENVDEHVLKNGKIRKPPPVTPRRFNKFFAPRPRNPIDNVRTSRKALRTISGSHLNTRNQAQRLDIPDGYDNANENEVSRKKRRFSVISSTESTPEVRSVSFMPSSQDALPSSPIRQGLDVDMDDCCSEASTEIDDTEFSHDEDDLPPTGPRIEPYALTSTSRSLLSSRLSGRRRIQVSQSSTLWQHETANFCSVPEDVNYDLWGRDQPIIPFSVAACNTNPMVAAGDEDGVIRFLNTARQDQGSGEFTNAILKMQPHDNAVMDLTFSDDDLTLATASGDQTCQIIDVQSHRSLYSLRAHAASVKRVAFQPGSGGKILTSAGRDGHICHWDLRIKGSQLGNGRRARLHVTDMASDVSLLTPVIQIYDAHSPNTKGRAMKGRQLAGRSEFTITSLSYLDAARSHLIVTASEVDTTIKLWDLRQSQLSTRKQGHSQVAVSSTQRPYSHERHRNFGINSIALSSDKSRIYALSRDHTVYAYSTSHLVLGTSIEMDTNTRHKTMAPMRTTAGCGVRPLYGFRHPYLHVGTFWPRLAVRKCDETNTELLAVASSEDCAVLFPLSEKYHTTGNQSIPPVHDPANATSASINERTRQRPGLRRQPTTSFTSLFTPARLRDDALPIYYHGTPLLQGHNKEVTSLVWTSEGSLITSSDDFTMRCWRENQNEASRLRQFSKENDAGELDRKGWAHVGIRGWDDE